MNHTQSYYHRLATLSQIFLYNIHSDICPISNSLQTFGAEFCTCDYFCRVLLLKNDNSFPIPDNIFSVITHCISPYHFSILSSLTIILLSAHFLLSLHLWSFRTRNTITNINPLLNQFMSLMIPPSVHLFSQYPLTILSQSLRPLTHSVIHRSHSTHTPFILTIESPLPYSKVVDKFTTSVH